MNEQMTKPIRYVEYAKSDRPTEFDPIERESVICPGQEPFRLTVQLLRWAAPKMVEYASKGGDLQAWTNCIGCDCAFITEAMKGVRALNGFGEIDRRELVDVIIYVSGDGWTHLEPIYLGESPDASRPTYESCDWIIICREFEPSSGHGMKWMEISPDQATKLLEYWRDNSSIGQSRPRMTSIGDMSEAVFLTNLTEPVGEVPVGGRDHCVISRSGDKVDRFELQKWYDRLRKLERNGDQDRLEDIANEIMHSGKTSPKVRDLVFGC